MMIDDDPCLDCGYDHDEESCVLCGGPIEEDTGHAPDCLCLACETEWRQGRLGDQS